MAVADATTAPAAAARPRGRAFGALAGLLLLAVAVGIFTQIGNLGLGLAPAVLLLLISMPLFLLAGACDPARDARPTGSTTRATRSSSR